MFRIGPNTVVNESTPTVEICISTNSLLEVNVVVTVVTETKSGVINQATGTVCLASCGQLNTFGSHQRGGAVIV